MDEPNSHFRFLLYRVRLCQKGGVGSESPCRLLQLHRSVARLEYGIEARKGPAALLRRLVDVLADAENELPFEGRALLRKLGDEVRRLNSCRRANG